MQMNKDEHIRGNVIAELRWVPDIDDTNIGVSVNDGIVTLIGLVPTFNDRIHAECAAKRVKGVTGVANEIKVSARSAERYSDAAIARAAVDAIRGDLPAVAGAIQVVVSDAHVVLEGNVEWQWQRQRIESTVRAVDGVAAVTNLLVVRPGLRPDDVKRRIEEAFVRSAEVDARKVSVDVNDGEITLRGAVSSLREKEEAQRTAWSAPGVRQVTNEIVVSG
jgi:osmotically-inducible protein OsmY